MSGKSAIEWTDMTWNPITGCTRVTSGCDHCYAFALHDMRHKLYVANHGIYPKTGQAMPKQYARPFSEIQIMKERLEDPLHIKKPQKIFVNSMADLFHSQVPEDIIRRIFQVMVEAHWHCFQILTKRPARMARLAPTLPWPENIWIGTSIELNQLTPRADLLRRVPTPNSFLSLEPLLGPLPSLDLEGIAWVIVGGESGNEARPMQADWVREIREKCRRADIPFLFKQWGGRTPKAGGRTLDGRSWDQFPAGMVNIPDEEQHINIVTPRDLAKELLRPYVERGDSLDFIIDGHMGRSTADSSVQIGPTIWTDGKRRDYPPTQIVVTEFAGQACLHVFSVAELVAELKAPARQRSLWEQDEVTHA